MTNDKIERMTECGFNRWENYAEALNTIILEDGKIEKDDRRIWDGYLHRWSNTDWLEILLAMEYLLEQQPEHFTNFHKDALQEATQIIVEYKDMIPRVMDKRDSEMNNKRISWKISMSMREVWNSLANKEIKQETRTSLSRSQKAKVSTYNNLFE